MSVAPEAMQQRLLQLGRLLADDGVPAPQQLSQIAYLLVLRRAQRGALLPAHCDWQELVEQIGRSGLEAYNLALIRMRDHPACLVGAVFESARAAECRPATLLAVMRELERLDGPAVQPGGLGAAYAGLLAHYAAQPRWTLTPHYGEPAALAALIALAQPGAGEVIVDPAANLGGALLAAAHARGTADAPDLPALAGHTYGLLQRKDGAHLALANLLLNDLVPVTGEPPLRHADPVTAAALAQFPAATLLLSDLATQRLPLRQELATLRLILGQLHAEGRAVLRVSPAVAGPGATARRLRAQMQRLQVTARYSPGADGTLLLELTPGPGAQPAPAAGNQTADRVLLADLATECRHGLSTARQVQGEGRSMLRASGVGPGYIREADRCRVRTAVDSPAGELALGDLLFVRNGSRRRVGVCALVQSAAVTGLLFPDKLIRVRVDTRRVLPAWIAACVNDTELRGVLEAAAIPSTGQYRITRKQLLGLRIPLPSLAEQQRLLARREPLPPAQAYTAR